MCGIVYVKRKDNKPAFKSVMKRYREQKFRGKEGFGYIAITDNQIVSYQRSETEEEIRNLMAKETASEILFHHRLPTSTPNVVEAAHPLFVEKQGILNSNYIVVHNGVITNDEELKEKHEEMGFKYATEMTRTLRTAKGKEYDAESIWNDSEALAIETALCLDGKREYIGTLGTAAVVAFEVNDTGKVLNRFFFRNNGNPLMFRNDTVMTTATSSGAGVDVAVAWIMKLTDEGELVRDERLFPPPSHYYRNPTPAYTGYGSHGQEFTQPKSSTAITPHYPTEDDFDYSQYDDEYVDSADIFQKRMVKEMTEGELWDENENATNARKEIEEEIVGIDMAVEAETVTQEMLRERGNLQWRLDNINGYIRLIEETLTKILATENAQPTLLLG